MDGNVRYKIRVRGIINVTRVPYGRLRIPSLLWALDLAPTMSIARLHFIKYKPAGCLTHADGLCLRRTYAMQKMLVKVRKGTAQRLFYENESYGGP